MKHSDMNREINITDKNIRQFTTDNTIYISKKEGDYQIVYFCKFVKFERGIVTGSAISAEPNWELHTSDVGKEKTARLKKCFLWGKLDGDDYEHCQWFKINGTILEEGEKLATTLF